MKRELKSIAHATIANGIHIYVPEGDKNYVVGSRLACAECNEPWYMNFTECFICGAVNPFLYRCDNCESFVSITTARRTCSSCGKPRTLHLECPNPKCLSNTDKTVHDAINKMGGVFHKSSGFRISSQYCLNCGSQHHKYQVRRISVFTVPSRKVDKKSLSIDDPEVLFPFSFIIFRIRGKNGIEYSFLKLKEYLGIGKSFELSEIYKDFAKVLGQIFSKEND